MLATSIMDNIRSQLRVDFLGYVEDNWKQDFRKLKKTWKRSDSKYTFDAKSFMAFLQIVQYYGYNYTEWDAPQTIYDTAMDLIAKEVVFKIEPI